MRSAFTIIELLVILTILGVMMVIIAPMISGGSDISRVRTATRGVMQMSRYARTMAVLQQRSMALEFSENGKLSVVKEGGGEESIVSARAFATTNAVADAEAARMAEFETSDSDGSGGGGTYVMADVNTEKIYEQIRFKFEGYTDTADAGRYTHLLSAPKTADSTVAASDENTVTRVRYRSNGTCRPYKVKISAEGENAFSLTVAVDMLGMPKVLEDEERK